MSLFVFSQFLIVIMLCQAEHETCGVFPKDPIIKMGSEIQIMFRSPWGSFCGSVPSYSPHKLIWKLNNKKIAKDLYIINSTMSAVTIRSSGIVTCHMHLGGRDVILGGTNITALPPPVKPTNIHCILFALEEFTCYWNSGNNSVPGTEFTVSGIYITISGKENCSSKTDHCTFETPLIFPLNITVTANNAVGSVDSDVVGINPLNKLKIRAPEVTVRPSLNKLEVHWKIPQIIIYPESNINCKLLYQYENVSQTKSAKPRYAEIVVERPCVNYTVSVSCAPDTVSEEAYWSDWSHNVTIISPLDVKAVEIYLWRKIDTPDERGHRTVMLMWKGVQPSCKIDGYKVTVGSLRSGDSVRWFNLLDSKTSLILDGKEHRISIAAYKNDNTSPEVSITVPAIGEDLPPVEDLQVSPKNSRLYITWTSPRMPVDRYMVEWSTGGDDVMWHESETTSTSLTGQPFKLYRISVSPLYNSWPGQEATLLAYFKEGVPGNISAKVTDIQDRSARVSWTAVLRSHCCGFVRNYTVFYKSGTGPELGVTVNSSVEEVVLENLAPGKNYNVHVMASSAGGTTNSTLHIFTTRRYGTAFLKTFCAFGGLGLILIITICLCCVVLMNKYFMNVPSPKFSTLALWFNEPFKDEMQSNICTPSSESYFHDLEIHPCSFGSTIIKISPSPPETPEGQNDQPHPVFEHIPPVRASALPSVLIDPFQTCGHSAESGDRRTANNTPGSQDPGDCNSTKPCWGSILGKNGYVGEETVLPPNKEMQPFLEPPKNAPQAYVTMDLFGQSAIG